VAKPFSIRLSEDERAMLAHEAGKLSLAAHIRQKLLGILASPRRGKKPSRRRHSPRVDQAALGRTLALLGRSELFQRLDELTIAAVMGALPVGPELIQELRAACAHIRAMRAALMEALDAGRTLFNQFAYNLLVIPSDEIHINFKGDPRKCS
jgi:hypothetical protein